MPANVSAGQAQIKHVFVLMLENRSYDHLLGYTSLKGFAPGTQGPLIEARGLSVPYPSNPNPKGGPPVLVSPTAADNLGVDPEHEFPNVKIQVCGVNGGYPNVTMDGFVASNGPVAMNCFAPGRLPALATLAAEFAVCDHWFSSLPGPTWPNRLFAHAATSGGLFCSPSDAASAWQTTFGHYAFENGHVFQAMDEAKRTWRIYHQGLPQTLTLSGMGRKYLFSDSFRDFSRFTEDLKNGTSADYTFIEPNYGGLEDTTYTAGDSQHPDGNIQDGEDLIRRVYSAIRASPLWPSSLLLITYDEHGGLYDHVKPPEAVPPGDKPLYLEENNAQPVFDFKTYGVRVPAVVVSPWIARSTVDPNLYDHSSISKTLHTIFATRLLTHRDAQARGLEGLLTLDSPRQDRVDLPIRPSSLAAVSADPEQRVEGLGRLLLGLGARVKSVLDGRESLGADGNPGAAVPASVVQELQGIETRGQAAGYLQRIHRRVLVNRQNNGVGGPSAPKLRT